MPSRPVIAAILLFWLGMAGWYVAREIAPRWGLDDVPPYHIDLTDEVGAASDWTIHLDGKPAKIGEATSNVRRLDHNTFLIKSEQRFVEFFIDDPMLKKLGVSVQVRKMQSSYVVTEQGELREMNARMVVRMKGALIDLARAAFPDLVGQTLRDGDNDIEVKGLADAERLNLTLLHNSQKVNVPGLKSAALPRNGKVLNPMFPLSRIPGLAPAQRWREPLIDPVGEMGNWLASAVVPKEVHAEVVADTLTWRDRDVPCLVIEYREPGKAVVARTWVRRRDALVLQQEATHQGRVMTLVRQPPP